MNKYLKNKLKQNGVAMLCCKAIAWLVLIFALSIFNPQVVNAQSKQGRLSVNVRVVGTCNISVSSGESLTDQVINSQCNDHLQGFTETDKLDFFDSSKSLTESFSNEGSLGGSSTAESSLVQDSEAKVTTTDKKKTPSDEAKSGQKHVELGVGKEENIRANIKTVKTVLFEG